MRVDREDVGILLTRVRREVEPRVQRHARAAGELRRAVTAVDGLARRVQRRLGCHDHGVIVTKGKRLLSSGSERRS